MHMEHPIRLLTREEGVMEVKRIKEPRSMKRENSHQNTLVSM